MRFSCFIAACLLAVPTFSHAQAVGLVIGNQSYDSLPNSARAARVISPLEEFERSGMTVLDIRDADLAEMRDALLQFGQRAAQAETQLIVLSGRFIHSPTETYFMPIDGENGPLATMPIQSLPLSTVFAWLSRTPGKSVLILAHDESETTLGPLLSLGIGALDIPQGVTVIIGGPTNTRDLMRDALSQPGRPFVGLARRKGMDVQGYAPNTLVLLDGPSAPPVTADNRLQDIRDWRAASRANTAESYQSYLENYPNGEFANMARGRLAALTDTPEARAERTEQALDLNREARRDIQRDLSLLGFNTRGIDGIFGRGTRAAIADWQRRERFEATGYLTREQIALLDEQARRRAEELEAEAEIRREQQRAADLDYWNQTGSRGDEAGLRAYLRRFPDGEFAELAQERLDIYEEQKRERASARDRQLWENARARNTAAAFERYLVDSPNGAFREEAQARIVALQREAEFSREARAEEAMNLSPGTRRVIEARLNGLGLRPGPVDGVFDEDTRRAIRRYQAARNLPETGYVSDQMMVQLMADTVRQIFR